MHMPILFDIVDLHLLSKWRDEIEKEENCNVMGDPLEAKAILAGKLDKEQKTLLTNFELALVNRLEYVYYCLCKQLFYFAFKAGADFQKALDEAD